MLNVGAAFGERRPKPVGIDLFLLKPAWLEPVSIYTRQP